MSWITIAGIASTIAFFIPVCLIIGFRLYLNKSLLALGIYYLNATVYNLMTEGLLKVSPAVKKGFGIIANYLDVPLMLWVLLLFCTIRWKQRVIYFSLMIFLAYELLIGLKYGLQTESVIYILGPGIALMLFYSGFLFVGQIRVTTVWGKSLGKTLMISSILFAYGCYALVYYFYYIQKTSAVADVFMIFFLTSIISSFLMSFGLFDLSKRHRQFQEVRVTRKELTEFFNN